MAADSGSAARALRSVSANPKELYDTTTYAKGAAVLRMVEAATGEEVWRRELSDSLLQERSLCLPEWADPFIETPGVPHVSIEWNGCTIRSSDHAFPLIPVAELSSPERVAFLGDLYDATWAAETDTLVLLRALEQAPDDTIAAELEELLTGQSTASVPALSALTGSRGAEKLAACETLLRHPATRRETWTYLKEHWDDLHDDLISFGGRGAIPALAAASDPVLRNDIAAFFARHPPHGAERALQQTLEQIDARIRFREREQRKYACRTIWIGAGRPAPTQPLRLAHALLNGLTAALYGSLHMRLLYDQFCLEIPSWMHAADDLRQAHASVDQLFLRLFRGEVILNEGVMQLARRAQEDLLATAVTAETADSPTIGAVLSFREAASRDYFLGGLIAFTDLFDGLEQANRWRLNMPAMERDLARIRTNLARIIRGERPGEMPENALLPRLFRSQARDLEAVVAELARIASSER
jgi:hypothetical protein